MSEEIEITPEELPVGFSVQFAEPFDCAGIFPEGGTATGAQVEDDGRFSLIGAGQGRIIGQLDNLTTEDAEERIKAVVMQAAQHNT